MQTDEKIRQKLLEAYESLPPPEQALVQLCSVIYEPVSVGALYKIFRKSGLSFPGEKIGSIRALEPHLQSLKELRLLNDTLQVPREVIEIVTRRAVAAGRIFTAGSLLEGIESREAWTDNPRGSHCISCGKAARDHAFMPAPGPLCPACATSEIQIAAAEENLHDWSVERILTALSPEGDLKSRLTVIWKCNEAERTVIRDMDKFLTLLVQNLGYVDPHPLAPTVREAALHACTRRGPRILPLLFKVIQKEPWQFYANVLGAMVLIASEKPEVHTLVKEAANDPNPEVRRHIIFLLSHYPPSWGFRVIEQLSRDEDSAIRKMAKDALTVLKSKQRRPFSAPFAAFGSSNLTSKYSMRFGPLVRAVHEELPLAHGYSSSYSVAAAPRILRDFRIGIYSQDMHLFRACLQDLYSLHSRLPDIDVSMAQICNDPFDTAWFAGLPTNVRMALLSAIFRQAVIHLEPDAEALAFTLKDPLFKSAPRFERAALLYDLVSRLILGGRLDDARRIIPEIDGRDYTGGLMGWVHFVEGKINDAIGSFEADLKEFRRRCGKRNINFTGTGGLFYVLALLKSGNIDLVKRAEQLVGWSLASMDDSDFKTSPYRSLKGIICAQNLKMEEAKRILETESKAGGVIPTLFNAIAAYWVNGRLSREMIERLEPIFQTAGQVGMDWVSMECAALLIRNNRATSMHREFLDRVIKQSGMRPLVSSIEAEEPWQKGLRAILEIAGASEEPVVQKSTSATRLIWLVGYYSGRVSLQPLEQRTMPKGGWTKGRPVAMSRLFNRTKLENLGPQDNAICAAIKHERSYYHGDTYTFDMDKLLPSLVGHPLLFMEQSPSVPVEFVKGEPEILVTQSGSMLNIRFAIEFGEDRVEVIQETPTRFKVIEFTDQHRRFAQVLGSGGLFVPASGKQDVLKAISALSSHALVYSEIGGRSKDVVEVASDPTPHVHLVPSGHGFRLEVFVKPFKEEGSPYLKPGVGATNVIAEVGGKRVQTQRDLKAEERMADALDAASPTISRLADSDRQCQLEDPEDCLQLLLDLKALQEEGQVIVEWPEGEKLKVTREVPIDRFRMKIRGRTEWFEVSGSLQVDDDLVIDMKRLLELVNTTSTRFIPLEEGQFLALTREFRKRLEELNAYAERKGKEVRLHPLAALAVQDLIKGIPNLEVDEAWKSRLERIRAGQEISPPVPSTFKAELRDYQLEGYWWMTRLAHMGIGACLADDMGLGKTIQVLAVMLQRASQGPALVVAPTSVCWNWLAEAHRFAPTLNMVQLNAMNREELVKGLKRHDVLVTSYGLLAQEAELLAGIEWSLIVLDEAQAIKNVLTQRSQAAMGLKGGFKIITTGTPIENHLGELWTLFNFINPGLLGSLQRFNERFAVPIEKYNNRDARKRLKKLIQPFILRRLKSQVLEELPPRTEVVLQVEMSPEETAFYEALRQQALARIEADSAPLAQKHLRILAEIMKLRQAACHPRLVLPETPLSSSKLELFDEVVSELLENRHKALVFSQFVGHLSLIREYLDQRNIGYRYLDGSTPPKERKKAVDAFQAGEGDLFLISLKAGGLGLNLTAADYVIHMDPWWNPAVEDQASDRAHRIGQQHPVTVYRLVTAGTIEEKIVKLHQEKRDLAGSLLDGSDISGKISAEELVRLIREA
ncbi:SNF2-related protein [Desulforhabdus sp. TSK]|uniref:SNF2-related protein n=1 Tax=Desulforhabdus sp. TSK TaxID=2925014 RepID=UPI001FC845BD|nr:SNF2-related protein [Desulforhabdus sp. TSK]